MDVTARFHAEKVQFHWDDTKELVLRALDKEVKVVGFFRILNPLNLEGLWIQAIDHIVDIRPDMKLPVRIGKEMDLLRWDKRSLKIDPRKRRGTKKVRKYREKNKGDNHKTADNRHFTATKTSPNKLCI